MRGARAGITAAVLLGVLLPGCSGGADPAPEDPSTPDAPTSEAATPATPTASEETSPSASATESLSAAEAQSLAIEQRHPNGSVLRVTSLTIEANAITVGVEVLNGATRDFGLSPGGAVVSLTDDLGGVYEFLRPTDNPELQIQQRGTLTGELVYFGVLNPEASTLRLQTNASTSGSQATTVYDPATEIANEAFPHFSVEIPLDP